MTPDTLLLALRVMGGLAPAGVQDTMLPQQEAVVRKVLRG